MHHHARVAQGDQAIGLVAVGEERPRHGLAHQQGDHRVAGEPSASVAVSGGGQGLMNAKRFFATAIGLAGYVDDSDDGALVTPGDGFVHRLGQAPAFQ